MKRWQIVFDDIGACHSIDDAVKILLEKNVVDGISIFVNSNYDLSWINEYKNRINIGLHLTFSFNKPLSQIENNELVDKSGYFVSPKKPLKSDSETIKQSISEYLNVFDNANIEFLKCEAKTQFERFVELFGKEPDFINLHHDLDKSARIRAILLELFPGYLTRASKLLANDHYKYVFHFLPIEADYSSSLNLITTMLKNSIDYAKDDLDSDVEIVFHPAYDSDELRLFSSYSSQREVEFRVLISEEVKHIICE